MVTHSSIVGSDSPDSPPTTDSFLSMHFNCMQDLASVCFKKLSAKEQLF